MKSLLLALLLLLPVAARADARLTIDSPAPLTELVITGRNTAATPRAMTVRIDDRPSPAYAERVNEERTVPPGPFTLRLRLAALRTPRGAPLADAQLKVIAFAPNGNIEFDPLHLDTPPRLPENVRGWYFGPAWSLPLQGFESVQPGDPRVGGRLAAAVNRSGGDLLMAHAMRLETFTADLPPGQWRLSIWTEDPGEWETLPPLLERRMRINGADANVLRRSFEDWVAQRYLAGRAREADPATPPFAAIGAPRGGRIDTTVTIGPNGKLTLELAGHPAAALNVTAITATQTGDGISAVESLRAARFAENWPVLVPPPPHPHAATPALTTPAPTTIPRDGLAILALEATVPAPATATATIEWDDAPLDARLYWGRWHWRRPGANSAGLAFSDKHLRADTAAIPLRPDLPRHLTVIVRGGTPGHHHGRLTLRWPGTTLSAPLDVEILDIDRPQPAVRVGAFLDFAPQFLSDPAWDKTHARSRARAQAKCDMDTLASLGLSSLIPPIGRLDTDFEGAIADITAAAPYGWPVIAYAPLRALGDADAARIIAKADAAIAGLGLPQVVWSVADEPAYNGTLAHAAEIATLIHRASPATHLAGHLNSAKDAALLPHLGLATVNPGAGADAADIAALRARGVAPYLYNMPAPRLAAGAYLWRSGADGFVQWHARMPTADPFDPTDGREGDVQFLWPTPGLCAPPDLDADLLALVDGAEDLRWLAWLDDAATRAPAAAALRRRLWSEIPATWADAERNAARATQWRQDVLDLARILKE